MRPFAALPRVLLVLTLTLIATAVLTCLTVPARGQGIVGIDLAGSEPGDSFTFTVNADGKTITVRPFGQLVKLSDLPGPTPTPLPNPTPVPSVLTDRAKAIKTAAEKVAGDADRDGTAKGLALLYREIAKLARTPGAVKDEPALANGLKVATNSWLASRGIDAPTQWQPMRDVFGTQWTAVKFKAGSLADYATLLDEAADGLDASAPLKRISPEMLQFIMMIIQLILSLLKPV